MSNPLDFLMGLVREQGDVARFENAYGLVHFFNHPDQVQMILQSTNFVRTSLVSLILGDGLLASEGEHWRSQRRLLQPHFHERCLQGFGEMITESASEMLLRWEKQSLAGDKIDLSFEMRRLTLGIILDVLFGKVSADLVIEMMAALRVLMQDLGDVSDTTFNVPMDFGPSRNARFAEALRDLDDLVALLLEEWRRGSDKSPGVVMTLLESGGGEQRPSLTPKQVRDEIVTMIVAGHETTAISLTWALALLAEDPDAERNLRAELDQVLNQRMPAAGDVANLVCTRMVLEEAMRMYPPVSVVARQALTAEKVAGVDLLAKGIVVLSAYTTHRHPEFWPDPDRFDPERFRPECSRGRHRYAYFPFLGGRHQCLGQPLAMLEGTLILAQIARCCRIHKIEGHSYLPYPGLALRWPDGFPVRVEFSRAMNVASNA